MDALIAAFLEYIQTEHALTNYETDPHRLCQALDILYIPGLRNMAHAGPPAFITIKEDEYGSRRLFNSAHEIVHVLMQRGGFKTAIQHEHANLGPRIKEHLEQLTNHAAGMLLMPEPLLREARRLYKDTPAAILHIADQSGVSLEAAIRRWTYQDTTEQRAAFLANGGYVRDVTACNCRLPFWRHDRLPEEFRISADSDEVRFSTDDADVSFARLPDSWKSVGLVVSG